MIMSMSLKKPVLLLNASYEPICTIGGQRAVFMMLDNTVDVVSSYPNEFIRSPSVSLEYPSVVKLVKYINVPRYRKAYLTRKAVLKRDNYECCYCGGEADTMDHVVPRDLGGPHRWENVVACCFSCNQRKANKPMAEMEKNWGWKMRFRPYRPDGRERLIVSTGAHPDWDQWLQPKNTHATATHRPDPE